MALAFLFLSSCDRVPPNYIGVLKQNYGKNGVSDYTPVKGSVSTLGLGTELFLVPSWEQRSIIEAELELFSADNSRCTSEGLQYRYEAIPDSAPVIVFNQARLGNDGFMAALESNVLEPIIYDVLKEESRKVYIDSLSKAGGTLRFEQRIENILKDLFKAKGLNFLGISTNMKLPVKIAERTSSTNAINAEMQGLLQQIEKQKLQNDLARLEAEEMKIRSEGLTEPILTEMFINTLPRLSQPLYGSTPLLTKYMK